jgi:hypothetical protein
MLLSTCVQWRVYIIMGVSFGLWGFLLLLLLSWGMWGAGGSELYRFLDSQCVNYSTTVASPTPSAL